MKESTSSRFTTFDEIYEWQKEKYNSITEWDGKEFDLLNNISDETDRINKLKNLYYEYREKLDLFAKQYRSYMDEYIANNAKEKHVVDHMYYVGDTGKYKHILFALDYYLVPKTTNTVEVYWDPKLEKKITEIPYIDREWKLIPDLILNSRDEYVEENKSVEESV